MAVIRPQSDYSERELVVTFTGRDGWDGDGSDGALVGRLLKSLTRLAWLPWWPPCNNSVIYLILLCRFLYLCFIL